jgi:hypothetical protein
MKEMTNLAKSFPTLRGADGLDPWDPEKLEEWTCGPVPGSGAFYAAQFVLEVWNKLVSWKCGPFRAVKAVNSWDHEHLAAFQAWVNNPWWP